MIRPGDDRIPPMTPQLALRVAVVGTLALVMFSVIFFRLWFLQVLSSNQYVAQAQGNITQKIPLAAPRGEILSSNGTQIVYSARVPAIEIAPPSLPEPLTLSDVDHNSVSFPSKDTYVFDSLAKVLQMSTKPSACKYEIYYSNGPVYYHPRLSPVACLVASGIANSAFANVMIKTDVRTDVSDYIAERQTQRQFQGVLPTTTYLRQYPYNDLAAQVLGTVGAVSPAEQKLKNFKGAEATDVVGQSGLEYQYNLDLSGKDGYEGVKVNSQNQFVGYATRKPPTQGANLETSLDLRLEQVGDAALKHSIATNTGATSGAWVAMDPDTGSVYGMGSLPSYNPSVFTHSISNKAYAKDFGANSGDPLINRAIDSPLPDGSTFKVITATAALEGGVWSASQEYDDTGEFCYPGEDPTLPGACLHNSGNNAYGPVDLERAIQVSDDVYFYHLGYLLNGRPINTSEHAAGGELQYWARKYGIGQSTGIDLPGEASGTLPSPALLKSLYQQEVECETATGIYAYTNGQGLVSATPKAGFHRGHKHPASQGGCGIANPNPKDDTWTVGDNVNTAVGQGDDQVTPMQLAVVYSALANPSGTIVTPHIGAGIESNGSIQKISVPAKGKLGIAPDIRADILAGLHAAAQQPGGTSDDVMGTFPLPVYGKTGTAQEGTAEQIATNTETDYAWYACFVPGTATSKPIVVVVSVEKGGFGDVAAAPVAREILSQWFLGKPGQYITGTSTDQ